MPERDEFIGEQITVAEGSGVKGPLRFKWRGREYETAEVESSWHDCGQPEGVTKPSWLTRRHRNCFVVRTASGERFRIYLDRGTKASAPRVWVLERRLARGD